ncbi:t-SNARE [Hysterangium stoloniferum]|nr:t-SNARE [Hysterangium stoloniferum]
MARDRLAAFRAQQQSGRGTVPSGTGGEGPSVLTQQGDAYEMSNYDQNTPDNAEGMTAFYAEIRSIHDSIQALNDNVSRISDLHTQSLSSMDEATVQQSSRQLDELTSNTRSHIDELKARIKTLLQTSGTGRDGQIRKQQTFVANQKFTEAIQNYQRVEQDYRAKYKQRMERQIKIVKPDATPEEIKAVVDEDEGQQVFAQALQTSTRYGETRAAYREVQERHEDIRRIERTMTELAQLLNDMGILVEQQDRVVGDIEAAAEHTEKNAGIGLRHTDAAVKSARRARRARWICFIIIVIIIAALALGLGLHFGLQNNKNNS